MPKGNNGKNLEDYVYENIIKFFKSDILPLKKELCVCHRERQYYSDLRKNFIKFENVVECFSESIENRKQPFLSIIFECKDYNRKVEVGEVEEFSHKINQGLGFRVKGYIITSCGFQSSAFNVAQKLGIGLIRILPEENQQMAFFLASCKCYFYTLEERKKGYLSALCGDTDNFDTETEFIWDNKYIISEHYSIRFVIFRELIRNKIKFSKTKECHFERKKSICDEFLVRNVTKLF